LKVAEIRALSTEELTKQLEAARQEFFNIRLRLASKQLANHRQVRVTKRKIARLETIMREKELGIRQV